MKTREEVAREVIGPDALNGVGYEQYIPWMVRAVEADRAQPENDRTLHAAVIDELKERAAADQDEAEGYGYRARAVRWIEENPNEFWDEFGAPLIDDIERKFWT